MHVYTYIYIYVYNDMLIAHYEQMAGKQTDV